MLEVRGLNGEIVEQARDLERANEPGLHPPVFAQPRDVVPGKVHFAGIGADRAGNKADEAGLAGAIRSD